MKKILLFIAAAIISFGATAQINSKAPAKLKSMQERDIDLHQVSCAPAQESNIISVKGTNGMSVVALGTSYNAYSILSDLQNQVAFNQELNTVAFTHRQNAGNVGGSGVISFDFSTDGGDTWTIDTLFTPAIANGTTPVTDNYGRYPNITIFNPAGNTDPDEAYAVGAGPLLGDYGITGYGWGMHYAASYKFDGTSLDEQYYATDVDTNNWAPRGLCVTKDAVWHVSTNFEWTNDPSGTDPLAYEKTYLSKGTYNAGTSAFDWAIAETFTPPLLVTDGAYAGYSHNMGFSTDGQVGYVVIHGVLAASPDMGYHPLVYKSTDAGANWNMLPDFDFASISTIKDSLRGVDGFSGDTVPQFQGFDVAVDANGALHIFAVIGSRYSSNVDSVSFSYAHPVTKAMYHVQTTDGTDWSAKFISHVANEDGDAGPGLEDYLDSRPQIATSPDGSKVFFTWLETETVSDTSFDFNVNPNVFAMGYDILDAEYTDDFGTNLTIGNLQTAGLCWFATMAPIVKTTGTGSDKVYDLQIVYLDPSQQGGSFDEGSPVNYMYISGAGFGEWTAIEDYSSNTISFNVYPNPANTTITVDYKAENNDNVEISISNLVGQVVNTEVSNNTIDVSNLEAGIYFVSLRINNNVSTQKLIIE